MTGWSEHSLKRVDQSDLDILEKERSSLFPWRGQFSPQLVEVLLDSYARAGATVFDPFAGVGTTLIEAAKLGMRGRGTELNPSAYLMAQSVEWVRLRVADREKCFEKALAIAARYRAAEARTAYEGLAGAITAGRFDSFSEHILTNAVMRMMSGESNLERAVLLHCEILRSLPFTEVSQHVFHADARETPLAPESVDLVITSPPYINVFNYHENHRKAMELLGWDILSVARAEVGSNRKHRGNRFFTVIQYCLDMQQVLIEIARLLKPGAHAIIIVGRESKVRGVSLENGQLLASLASGTGFEVSLRQERKFLNRFGQTIFEDILHLNNVHARPSEAAKSVATDMLTNKLTGKLEHEVRRDIEAAIASAEQIQCSPIFRDHLSKRKAG